LVAIENLNDPNDQKLLRGHDMEVRCHESYGISSNVNLRDNILYLGFSISSIKLWRYDCFRPVRDTQLQRILGADFRVGRAQPAATGSASGAIAAGQLGVLFT
jgi:hypothetical protein